MTRRTRTSFKPALLAIALACVFMHAPTAAADEVPSGKPQGAWLQMQYVWTLD